MLILELVVGRQRYELDGREKAAAVGRFVARSEPKRSLRLARARAKRARLGAQQRVRDNDKELKKVNAALHEANSIKPMVGARAKRGGGGGGGAIRA